MFKKLGLLLSVLILVLAACGDDGPSLNAEERELADALAADLIADPDNPMTSDADAACVADAIVTEYGVERLGDLEIEPGSLPDMGEFGPNMSDAEKDAFVDIYFDCVDIEAVMASGMAEDMEGPFTVEDAQCVVESLGEDALREGMLAELNGEDWEPAAATLLQGFADCVDLEELILQSMREQGLDEGQVQCIGDGLDDTDIVSLFGSMLGEESNPDAASGFSELVMSCIGG